MSSEFAEFLFAFACNKLESSPQLDLRQQLLHSNLIRQILLTHQHPRPSTESSFSKPSQQPKAHSESQYHQLQPQLAQQQLQQQQQHQQQQQQFLLALPPLPPSPPLTPVPQSLSHPAIFQSFQLQPEPIIGVTVYNWSAFSFDDELDRITREQDVDMDMEHDLHTFDYGFDSTQAQEEWLDAVLEDLIEEDQPDESDDEGDWTQQHINTTTSTCTEDALREHRFVQLTQELGSAIIQEPHQESSQIHVPTPPKDPLLFQSSSAASLSSTFLSGAYQPFPTPLSGQKMMAHPSFWLDNSFPSTP